MAAQAPAIAAGGGGEAAADQLLQHADEVGAQPGMLAELPGVGELVEDEPAAQRFERCAGSAGEVFEVGLDEVEGGARAVDDGVDAEQGVVLTEHALGHDPEEHTDVAVHHPPAEGAGPGFGEGGPEGLDRGQQAAGDVDVDVDEAVTVEDAEAGEVLERPLAHLGHQRRQAGGHLVAASGDGGGAGGLEAILPRALVGPAPDLLPVEQPCLDVWPGPEQDARRDDGAGTHGAGRQGAPHHGRQRWGHQPMIGGLLTSPTRCGRR